MASPDLTLIADIDFRKGSRKLNRQLRGIEKRGVNIDTRKSSQALGRITGKADEFTKSLEASNARVIAFGASVAVIEGVRRSFVKLVDTVVQVEAQLTAINSILGRTSGNLQKFGNELFEIAKQTGQAYDLVATTAQEFARQGLSVEQTLSRTKDALILQRLTTLKSEESVASITAALNAFDKQALTSTQVINKLRAVETSFAVSSGDLADALARSASVAQDAGVSFDELLGVITAIKQRTGLGGSTIGQGLKTVFTRLNLPTRIEQLRELGVTIDESAGGLEKLRQVSIAVGKAQEQGNVSLATQIGAIAAGQFQISKLSAAFSDLSSQYSVTDAAALKSASATNEAIIANEQYNETIKSLANSVNQNIGQILTKVGELGTQDVIKNFVKDLNSLLEAAQGNKAKAGTFLGEIVSTIALAAKEFGVLRAAAEGFANVLTGPGLVAAGSIIGNLFKNTLLQGGQSLLSLTGINNKTKRRAELQMGVNKLLDQATAAEMRNFQAAKNVAAQQQIILGILQRQVAMRNSMANAPILGAIGGRSRVGRQVRKVGTGDFAEGRLDPIAREKSSIKRGVGGASPNAEVRVIKEFNYGSGKVGPAVVNTDEVVIPSKKGDIVLNRDMMRGAKNFAIGSRQMRELEISLSRPGETFLNSKELSTLKREIKSSGGLMRAVGSGAISRPVFEAIIREGGLNNLQATTSRSNTGNFQRGGSLPPSEKSVNQPFGPLKIGSQANRRAEAIDFNRLQNTGILTQQESLRRSRDVGGPPVIGSAPSPQRAARIKAEEARKRAIRNKSIAGEIKFEQQSAAFFDGQSVAPQVKKELADRLLNEELKKIEKERGRDFLDSKEGRKVENTIKNKIGRQIAAQDQSIKATLREKSLTQARIALDDESRKGIRGKLGFRLGSAEREALKTKGLDKVGKAQIRKEVQDRKFARGQRLTQGAFIGSIAASFAAPAIGKGVGFLAEKASGDEETGQKFGRGAQGLVSGAASGAALGAMFGVKGLAVGTAVGGIGGLVTGLKETKDPASDLQEKLKDLNENFSDVNNGIDSYLKSQSRLNELFERGKTNTEEVSRIRNEGIQSLFDSGLSSENITKITTATSEEDRGKALQDIRKEFSAQQKELETKIALRKIGERTSITSVSRTGRVQQNPGENRNLAKIKSGFGDFFGATRTQLGFESDLFKKNTQQFAKTKTRDKKGFKTDDFKQIESILFSNFDLDKVKKDFDDAGKSIYSFRAEFGEGLLSDDIKVVEKTFEDLGLTLDKLPEHIRNSEKSLFNLARLLSETFSTGGRFQQFLEISGAGEIQAQASAVSSSFKNKVLRSTDLDSSILKIGGLKSRLSEEGDFSRQESALRIAQSSPLFSEGGAQSAIQNRQKLERDKLDSKIKRDTEEIFQNFASTLKGQVDENTITPSNAQDFQSIISSLQSATSFEGAMSDALALKPFLGENQSALNGILDNLAENIEINKEQTNFQRDQLKTAQKTENIIRNLNTRGDQIGKELGGSLGDLFGTGDISLGGVVRSASLDKSSQVNTVIQNEAEQIRSAFVESLKEKDSSGNFVIPESQQKKQLSVFDRAIRESGFAGSGVSKFDPTGRANFALDRVEEQKGFKTNTKGREALRAEIGNRDKVIKNTIESAGLTDEFSKVEAGPEQEKELSAIEKTIRERAIKSQIFAQNRRRSERGRELSQEAMDAQVIPKMTEEDREAIETMPKMTEEERKKVESAPVVDSSVKTYDPRFDPTSRAFPYFEDERDPFKPIATPDQNVFRETQGLTLDSRKEGLDRDIQSTKEEAAKNEAILGVLKLLSDNFGKAVENSQELKEILDALKKSIDEGGGKEGSVEATVKYILQGSGSTTTTKDEDELIRNIAKEVKELRAIMNGKPPPPPTN